MDTQKQSSGRNDEIDLFEQLQPFLLRAMCPTMDELGDFILNQIEERERLAIIDKHVINCHRCQTDIARIELFLAEDIGPVRGSTLDKEDLVSPNATLPISISSPTGHFRGGQEEIRQLMYELEIEENQIDLTIFLAIQQVDDRMRIQGMLLSDAEFHPLFSGAIVEVSQQKSFEAVTAIEDGAFECQLTNYASFSFRLIIDHNTQIHGDILL